MNAPTLHKMLPLSIIIVAVAIAGYLLRSTEKTEHLSSVTNMALAAQFEHLSTQTTNSCGGGKAVVADLPDNGRLQGSCCGPMNMHSYEEQIAGLKAYSDYEIIPQNPYDVPVTWARQMIEYGEQTKLNAEQQALYDEAVELSHEGGPCCCVCWHWYAYEGLAKYLIINEGFSAEQVAEVWDLSDACGGEHAHH